MWLSFCVRPALPEHPLAEVLTAVRLWPVGNVCAGVTDADTTLAIEGDGRFVFRLASLSKAFTAWGILVAVEEGSVSLEDPVGPPGATLRHCLAHAAGYPFEGREPIAHVGARRIYSNTGIEVASEHVAARTGIPFEDYLHEAVFAPLHLGDTALRGSPAHGVHSSARDTLTFSREILRPTLISSATAAEAMSTQYADLAGIVPGMGSFDPNPWGLALEIHGDKYPHWMGSRTSPSTVGHFGGAGAMFWVDPDAGLALVALTDRPFDEWADIARAQWSALSDAVVAASFHR
ncbi:MAG: hypothetical protein RLZ37_2089 [Actinomycetota bacterium]